MTDSGTSRPEGGTASPDVRAARTAFENDIRTTILNAAAAVLRDEGPAAFTVRRIATAVNASTKAVYTHFGNKDGLFDALYLQSFADLAGAMQDQIATAEPGAALLRICYAYRDYARTHPTRYNIMFGDLGRAYEAPLSSRRKAFESFGVLRQAVEACLPPERNAEKARIARLLWATMHGVVSLELRGLLGAPNETGNVFGEAAVSICRAWNLPVERP